MKNLYYVNLLFTFITLLFLASCGSGENANGNEDDQEEPVRISVPNNLPVNTSSVWLIFWDTNGIETIQAYIDVTPGASINEELAIRTSDSFTAMILDGDNEIIGYTGITPIESGGEIVISENIIDIYPDSRFDITIDIVISKESLSPDYDNDFEDYGLSIGTSEGRFYLAISDQDDEKYSFSTTLSFYITEQLVHICPDICRELPSNLVIWLISSNVSDIYIDDSDLEIPDYFI